MKKVWMIQIIVCVIILSCICTNLIPCIRGEIPVKPHSTNKDPNKNQLNTETSIICGYVYDSSTGVPLEYVDVSEYWEDQEGQYYNNYTQTESTGLYLFYSMPNVTFHLNFYNDGYFSEYSPYFYIEENEIFWYNISMTPYPPVTVHFNGYIIDNISGLPIEGADIQLNWYDNEGHNWYNYTESNATGYYSIGSIPGRTYIYADMNNYYDYNSGEYFTENNSLVWLNISLIPSPPVSAVVCGYITDAQNGDPIPDASVNLHCFTEYGHWNNHTITNEIGYYSVGTIPGTIYIYVYNSDYESTQSDNRDINENETLWINLSMNYIPMVTSLIKGYVVDNETSSVVRNAFVRFDWKDEVGHFYSKYNFTDQKGFYSITVPEGTVQFLITANGYSNQQISWFDISFDTELWLNTTLSPEITLEITKPHSGLYINNESKLPVLFKIISRFFPGLNPLIIGPLEITVNITKSTMGCNRVEFYIDNSYKRSDIEAPFTYFWNATGFSKHVIRVIAYDNAGPCTIETLMVRKLS
jgi:hypothetical protein